MNDDFKAITSTEGPEPATRHDVTEGGVIGALGGAIVGGFAGGPLGAVIGAVVGGAASAVAVDVVDRHDHDIDRTPDDYLTDLEPRPTPTTDDDSDRVSYRQHATDDDSDTNHGDRKLTDDDVDVNTHAGDELPIDDSVPNSDYSSAPNRVFQVGEKNTRDTHDYSEPSHQPGANIAMNHVIASTAPGAQAATDRRIFGGEPVGDETEIEREEDADYTSDDETETPQTPAD